MYARRAASTRGVGLRAGRISFAREEKHAAEFDSWNRRIQNYDRFSIPRLPKSAAGKSCDLSYALDRSATPDALVTALRALLRLLHSHAVPLRVLGPPLP